MQLNRAQPKNLGYYSIAYCVGTKFVMKVLFLPGFLQNGHRLRQRSKALESMLNTHGLSVEYVDPPMKLLKKEQAGYKLGSTEEEAEAKWQLVIKRDFNRCWWDYQGKGDYKGFDESFKWIVEYINKNGPYFGIVGFSQGSAMAAILTNTITRYSMQPQFKFTICILGFAFTEPLNTDPATRTNIFDLHTVEEYLQHVKIRESYKSYYTRPSNFSTKVIVVFGEQDPVCPPARVQYLARTFPKAIEIGFDGGHDVPSDADTINKIEAEIPSISSHKL